MFLCVCCFANAQRPLADSLFEAEEYLQAAVAYEWAIFSEKSNQSQMNDLLIRKSDCYLMMGNFEKALEVLDRGAFFNKDSIETLRLLYTKHILAAYLSGSTSLAYHKILQAESTLGASLPEEIAKIKPFVLIDLGHHAEAKAAVSELAAWLPDTVDLEVLAEVIDQTDLKNPNKASNMSYFLPGSGMFYTKNYGKGILSATIQGVAASYGLYGLLTGYFFTASIPGIGMLFTFYSGGARYAGILANKRNEQTKGRWKRQLGASIYPR